MSTNNTSNSTSFYDILNGDAGAAQAKAGISTRTFALNLATGFALFIIQISAFFLLKSSDLGRRIYQPKTYLVQPRLRVEAIPANPVLWLRKIIAISGKELVQKCGLDGYLFIRFIRAMLIIFVPLMAIVVTVLLPVNYNGGEGDRVFIVQGHPKSFNVTGLDTLAWQNVAPTSTDRYWAHLVCALLVISWTLYRIYREKLHFLSTRQAYLMSPEHRLKASARTVLITNIPDELNSEEALKALYDVFVDNDDRSRLNVWINRDYGPLKSLIARRRKLRHALEKEELKSLRMINKQHRSKKNAEAHARQVAPSQSPSEVTIDMETNRAETQHAREHITLAFEADCQNLEQAWQDRGKKSGSMSRITLMERSNVWLPASSFNFWSRNHKRTVPKVAWLRAEIARSTFDIDQLLQTLDDEKSFKRLNSAFIQFDRQMSAQMACALVGHHLPGQLTPRYQDVAPHEIVWKNMVGSNLAHFIKLCAATILFVGMIVVWGIPATFLSILSQLETLRYTTSYLSWLRAWPAWLVSLISGPVSAILLALLVQLVVPALCRKLAVLVGAPTRGRREVITQSFYFTFLLIELVLVTSISSGIFATLPLIIQQPTAIATKLGQDLPRAANYFFNYLIIQGLGFSGSVLFQYLRVLYITTIWPWFTQTPREEAWLQTTIPHQMWGNVYSIFTIFAVIGLIYSVIAPLMLIFVSATFMLFWVAYRHNYYYVQRVKVDSHGALFEGALSQLFAGVYILELALVGLFFLVRDTDYNVACKAQAIIMIIVLIVTAIVHYIQEQHLRPLYELLPVTLEDAAAEAEKRRFLPSSQHHAHSDSRATSNDEEFRSVKEKATPAGSDEHLGQSSQGSATGAERENTTSTAAGARDTMTRLKNRTAAKLASIEALATEHSSVSRRIEVGNQLSAAIAGYPDELSDLSTEERKAELRAAYQDPVTREPPPVIWIPQDKAGVSEDMIKQSQKYGEWLQYSNAGAFLTGKNKCEVTRPAPDLPGDSFMSWEL